MAQFINGEVSLTEEITDTLRARIISGEYKMGEKLVENNIATELKVSRTPVREAFKELANEGLIDYIPNKGCYAKGFTKKDIADIFTVRKVVEQLAVQLAIEHADSENLEKLGEQLKMMTFFTENNMKEKLLEANEEFHNIIFRMSKSRFIVQVLRSYQDYVHMARQGTLSEPENLKPILEEHKRIYEAIKEGNIEKANEEVEKHLEGSSSRAMKCLAEPH